MVVEAHFSSSRWEIHRPIIVDMTKPELVGAFKNTMRLGLSWFHRQKWG
jgi:hypothetical protein